MPLSVQTKSRGSVGGGGGSGSGGSGISGFSGFSAETSGYSGYSGTSGFSSFSGFSAFSGTSGQSGYSAFSGYSGAIGTSGFSSESGESGVSGYSGYSGAFSGSSGYSAFSGYSGFSGQSATGYVESAIESISNTVDAASPVRYKTGKLNTYSFDPDTNNAFDFVFEVPVDLVLTTDISVVVAYHMSSTDSGNVKLSLDYDVVNDGEDSTPSSSTGTITQTLTSLAASEVRAETTFTVPYTDLFANTESLRFTFTRLASDVADTHIGNFRVESVSIRYLGFGAPASNSGLSGFSGQSGYSSFSGYSGTSGYSSFSGYSGKSGTSGWSAFSGFSGKSGTSGWSAFSGYSGTSGVSGYSGYSAFSGYSGFSGFSSFSGFSGYSGKSGFSSQSGVSGFSGANGTIGSDGASGYSGYSGLGISGTSGYSGYSGASGYSGFSGTFSGESGYSGVSGFSGQDGSIGVDGQSGYSGYSGLGLSGYSGYSGYSSFSGYSGYSGSSGVSGTTGTGGYIQTTSFNSTPPSTSTITTTVDLSATILKGYALRYKVSGTYYFGICTNITASTITIAGAPLSLVASSLQELWYATPELTQEAVFFVAGRFADAADSGLLQNDQKTFVIWGIAKAYLARMYARAAINDTGASQPRVNITFAGNAVNTSNSNAGLALTTGWASSVVDVNTSNYMLNFADALEIIVDNNGTNKDAENLTVQCTFVFDR